LSDKLTIDWLDGIVTRDDLSNKSDSHEEFHWVLGSTDSCEKVWVRYLHNELGHFYSMHVGPVCIRMVHNIEDVRLIWDAIGFSTSSEIEGRLNV